MADFSGDIAYSPGLQEAPIVTAFWNPGGPPADAFTATPVLDLSQTAGTLLTGDFFADSAVDFSGDRLELVSDIFLEKVWSVPGRIDLGNIISTVIREIELYNAYRTEARSLTAATPNAGAGISFDGLPGLPAAINAQSGLFFDVVVSSSGAATINGTLDFTLDSGTLQIPITGTRVIVFPFEPESPLQETLEFKTDILKSVDGTEQRISVRKHPRQIFNMMFRILEGGDRRTFQIQLFGSQAAIVGLPMWHEARFLTSDASTDDTVIYVDTSYGDFRANSLVVLWRSPSDFEAQEISSFTSSSITISSNLVGNFPAQDTLVMPMRTVRGEQKAEGRKYIKDLDEYNFRFTVLDNEADLADATPYNSYNGRVVLDDPNWIGSGQTIEDSAETYYTLIDNESASIFVVSDWNNAQFLSTKGFVTNTPKELWQVRRLIHAFRGSQVSFYIPTFYSDVIPIAPLGAGSNEITIENIGYTDFVGGNNPFGALWLLKTDGTVIRREITATQEVDDATERLTVDANWGELVALEDIDRISFMRLSRIADDKVQLQHFRPGEAQILMATTGVQQ